MLAVTAYPDENVKVQVLELGGRFLLKPGADDADGFFSKLAGLLREGNARGIVAGCRHLAGHGNPAPGPAARAPGRDGAGCSATHRCP